MLDWNENMKKVIFLLLLSLIITSCTSEPDLKRISQNFNAHTTEYKQLGTMVREDFQGEHCFTIGIDHMGKYWADTENRWSHQNRYEEKMSLEQVLSKLSISVERYNRYKTLFKITGTERASFCKKNESYSFLAYRAGISVSGCTADIVKEKPIPESFGKRNQGDFTEIILLRDGWFIRYSCT